MKHVIFQDMYHNDQYKISGARGKLLVRSVKEAWQYFNLKYYILGGQHRNSKVAHISGTVIPPVGLL